MPLKKHNSAIICSCDVKFHKFPQILTCIDCLTRYYLGNVPSLSVLSSLSSLSQAGNWNQLISCSYVIYLIFVLTQILQIIKKIDVDFVEDLYLRYIFLIS